MGPLARLIAAATLAWSAACGARIEQPATPAFAVRLPGATAAVLWAEAGAEIPAPLLEAVGELGAALGLQQVADDAAVAYRVGDGVPVGWASLAEAAGFREALGRLEADGPVRGYLDLQLLLAAAIADRRLERIGPLAERVVDALALRGFRYLIWAGGATATGFAGAGLAVSSGASAGLPGLLTSPVAAPVADAALPGRDALEVEACWDPAVAARVAQEMAGGGDRPSLFDGIAAGPARWLARLVTHLGGRLSARSDGAGGGSLVLQVRDRDGLLEALADAPMRRGERELPEGVEVVDGWLLGRWPATAPLPSPPSGPPRAGPFVAVSAALAEGRGRLALELKRRDADAAEVRLDVSR